MKTCFIISPIGFDNSPERDKLEGLAQSIFKPILDKRQYLMELPHELKDPGSISDQIIKKIDSADLVIANLTGINGNVMYELAIRHFCDKPVIIIAESGTLIPFDISDQRVIFYDDNFAGYHKIVNKLNSTIEYIENQGNSPNPINKALKKIEFSNPEVLEKLVEKILRKQKDTKSSEPKHRTEQEIENLEKYFTEFEEASHKLLEEKFPATIVAYEKNIKLKYLTNDFQFDALIETQNFFYLIEIRAKPHGRTASNLAERLLKNADRIRTLLFDKTGIQKDFKVVIVIPDTTNSSVRLSSSYKGIIIARVNNEMNGFKNQDKLAILIK